MTANYDEKLPTEAKPADLPLRKMAPCWADGRVETQDYDNKDAECQCRYFICLVDWRNIIKLTLPKI